MPRPKRCRRICREPDYVGFSPDAIHCAEIVCLSLDEYEVIRLVDYEKKTHEQCARQMDISRTTVTEIYENARYKLADCIIGGKRLVIGGGNYRLCGGSASHCCGKDCCVARGAADQEDGGTATVGPTERQENEL